MSRACFETPSDGLADIIQGLGLRASLGDAARNGGALRNKHAGLVGLQRHEQLHTWILLHHAPDERVPHIGGAELLTDSVNGFATGWNSAPGSGNCPW